MNFYNFSKILDYLREILSALKYLLLLELSMRNNRSKETLNRHKSKRRFPAEFKLANGKIISDHKVIADAFNDYFIGIGEQDTETPQGNSHYFDYLSNKPNCNLQFHPIN